MADIIHQIFAGKIAAATSPSPSRVGRPYRPGSGTEGMAFDDHWCAQCTRDVAFRESDNSDGELGCKILSATFVYDADDPNYPKEWVYDRDGTPTCTAFTTDPKQPVRCDKTPDMFAIQ
jgi:hypothetical protein